MKLPVLLITLALPFCLYGQYPRKKNVFEDICFNNPSAVFCANRDFVIKPEKPSKYGTAGSAGAAQSSVDATGIDWRFADPAADAVAVLDASKLSGAAFAHTLVEKLAANQGLTPEQTQKTFKVLSSLNKVALSVHENAVLILVTGRPQDAILPALDKGWKSLTLEGNALLIGNAEAVDQASRRLAAPIELEELPLAGLARTTDGGFWLAGSTKLAGPDAAGAGVKQIEMTASFEDHLTTNTVFEFADVPDAAAIHAWMSTLTNPAIDGPTVRAVGSISADEFAGNVSQVAASPMGRQLAAIISSARNLPARDTSETVHTKPVIFGLDGGPRETH